MFKEPSWLYAALPILLLCVLLLVYSAHKRRESLARFVTAKHFDALLKSVSPWRRGIKNALFLTALVFLFLALARPHWGHHWQEVKSKGIDVLIALDTSQSMLAEDLRPNRLDRAKLAILDLLPTLKSDRIGLIAFAGSAFLQCPLTLDYDAFKMTLESVDTRIIPVSGTDIYGAIGEAESAFDPSANEKVLILVTDGEDHGGEGLKRAREAAEAGIIVYTLGVGTREGAVIPVRTDQGRRDYLRDAQGQVVHSRLVPDSLTALSEATGGFYVELAQDPRALERIYASIIEKIDPQERENSVLRVGIERFQYPLACAFLLLVLEILISARKRIRNSGVATALFLASCGLFIPTQEVWAQEKGGREAQDLYTSGNYDAAVEAYAQALNKHPEDAKLHYNLGTALYKAQQFERADQAFEQAIESANQLDVQAKAFYNRGNVRFRLGQAQLQSDPKQTIARWEQAIEDYENALELDAGNEATEYNLERVKELLEQLKKQLDQSQQEHEEQDQENSEENPPQQDDSTQNESQNSQQEQSSQEEQQQGEDGSQSDGQSDPKQSPQENSDGESADTSDSQQPSESQGNSEESEKDEPSSDAQSQQDSPDSQGDDPSTSGAPETDRSETPPQEQDKGEGTPTEPESQSSEEKGNSSSQEADSQPETQPESTDSSSGTDTETSTEQPGETPVQLQGMMTLEEALRLLESSRAKERKLPFIGTGKDSAQRSRKPEKNW